MCAVASGSWGGQRPSLASYVAVTGPTGGATASPEGGNVGYPLFEDSDQARELPRVDGKRCRHIKVAESWMVDSRQCGE